mgnify:CR=1 FL=1
MCLIAWHWQPNDDTPLVLLANRDEFYARPTRALAQWANSPVIAGQDLEGGGTWLGVTPQGRVAMLTNVREASVPNAPQSRGELVTRWLQGDTDWQAFAHGVQAELYSGFNLVLGDLARGEWAWISNRRPSVGDAITLGSVVGRPLATGIYGLSNAALDTPWPKTVRLKRAMQSVVDQSTSALTGEWRKPLLSALLDRRQASAELLPTTGAPRVWEQALSSPFVDFAERRYGTRSSLLVCASTDEVQMEEWTHERSGALPATDSRWPTVFGVVGGAAVGAHGVVHPPPAVAQARVALRGRARERRAARTVMHECFERITAWLAPLIPFTMEEAWAQRFPEAGSNCLRVFPETPAAWRNAARIVPRTDVNYLACALKP